MRAGCAPRFANWCQVSLAPRVPANASRVGAGGGCHRIARATRRCGAGMGNSSNCWRVTHEQSPGNGAMGTWVPRGMSACTATKEKRKRVMVYLPRIKMLRAVWGDTDLFFLPGDCCPFCLRGAMPIGARSVARLIFSLCWSQCSTACSASSPSAHGQFGKVQRPAQREASAGWRSTSMRSSHEMMAIVTC